MALNVTCPKCGSTHVQLSNVKNGHGCLWTILFGVVYFVWVFIKFIIGLTLLLLVDWWVALIMKARKKSYNWISKKFFGFKKKYFYCHDCGHNFKSY